MDQRAASNDWRHEPSRQLPPVDLHRSALAQKRRLPEPFPTLQPQLGPPVSLNLTQMPIHRTHTVGLIQCELDLQTGSAGRAGKRKSNSDATRRSRKRKHEAEEQEKELQAVINHLRAQVDLLTDENSSLRDQLASYQSR